MVGYMVLLRRMQAVVDAVMHFQLKFSAGIDVQHGNVIFRRQSRHRFGGARRAAQGFRLPAPSPQAGQHLFHDQGADEYTP